MSSKHPLYYITCEPKLILQGQKSYCYISIYTFYLIVNVGNRKKTAQRKSSVEFSKMASLEEETEETKKKAKSKVKGQQLLTEKK